MADEMQNQSSADIEHMKSLLRHIDNVRDAAILMGERLIKEGELEFAKNLIHNSMLHDTTKFKGIEWTDLRDGVDPEKLKAAHLQHVATNPHHPEYWGGINNMPDVYLAEMICDCYSRAIEAATDLRTWIKEKASERYDISLQGRVYKTLKRFIDLLLDKPLEEIK